MRFAGAIRFVAMSALLSSTVAAVAARPPPSPLVSLSLSAVLLAIVTLFNVIEPAFAKYAATASPAELPESVLFAMFNVA